MKILAILMLLVSVSAFAKTKTLFSADLCSRAHIVCSMEVGVDFAWDQDGRCGCLKKTDYLPMRTCMVAMIKCDERKGETFSTISTQDGQVGCGCFKTQD